ncbi:circadian clock protein KaiB [Roseospira marina]|uniref:Circadian clock protein KaiB n=1 Tax=Roseospira marina TaxID=140057 RepID=A0A5M6IFQ5_9PROT|nr:circadian clock KaiB family protein [Roseospira marina]KAA5607131.1 circadian clock protein KaiB [Roseospira marina]MBB4312669.1 circadian clock protein KaiB [Roseospira marina]MBB5086558.1 circadian clock protein KaiB [Roseospira marina]
MTESLPSAGVDSAASRPGLRLFILGQTETVRRAIANARQLGAVEIIDVRENPQAAEQAHVLATPTLVRTDDARIRIVGDLRNLAAVRAHLGPPYEGDPEAPAGDGDG